MRRLTALDLVCAVTDDASRPMNFAIALHLTRVPALDALEAGAAAARRHFPTSACTVDGARWRLAHAGAPRIAEERPAAGDAAMVAAMAAHVDASWDLRTTPAVQQVLLHCPDGRGATLLSRFHHAATDGIGAMLWLRHQLEVAVGAPPTRTSPDAPVLRRARHRVRRSRYAFRGPAEPLCTELPGRSPLRRWHTIAVPAAPLLARAAHGGGVTYNDLLVSCALETFRRWNAEHAPSGPPRVGVWLPMNVRAAPLEGFGNGTSRIRVYARYPHDATPIARAHHVREQIDWSRAHGEWALPSVPELTRAPMRVLRPLLRAWFDRPGVDMATGAFSHIERSPVESPVFDDAVGIDTIAMRDTRHAMGIFGVTRAGTTHLTFVHDPARLGDAATAQLVRIFETALAELRDGENK